MDARLIRAVLICTLLLGGCASAPDTCAWVKPIYPSHKDVLTTDTKRQILTHNETIEKSVK